MYDNSRIDRGRRLRLMLLGPSRHALGGVSTHLDLLLSSVIARDHEVFHFHVGSGGGTESWIAKLWRIAASPTHLWFLLIQWKPDIVHLNTSLEPKSYWRDLAYLVVARVMGKPVIYQVHGGALPQDFFRGNAMLTGLLRWALRSSAVVVLLAQAELNAYRKFEPAARLEVIPNGISIETLTANDRTISRNPLRLVYIGRLGRDKGIFDFVDAAVILSHEGREFFVNFAGWGTDEGELRERVVSLGLGARVKFHGPVFGPDKERLWRESDVLVFPTYHREGLPYALLESMALGVVPISTRVGAIPDVVHTGVHGFLVPVKDPSGIASAIARLDEDRHLLVAMAKAARSRIIEHYSVARMVGDFRRLYRSVSHAG